MSPCRGRGARIRRGRHCAHSSCRGRARSDGRCTARVARAIQVQRGLLTSRRTHALLPAAVQMLVLPRACGALRFTIARPQLVPRLLAAAAPAQQYIAARPFIAPPLLPRRATPLPPRWRRLRQRRLLTMPRRVPHPPLVPPCRWTKTRRCGWNFWMRMATPTTFILCRRRPRGRSRRPAASYPKPCTWARLPRRAGRAAPIRSPPLPTELALTIGRR